MPDSDQKPLFSLASFSAIIIGYLTICGLIYHLGYWSTFSFNYLEYVDLNNLFKSIIYPFFSRSWAFLVLIIYAFGSTWALMPWLMRRKKRQKTFPEKEYIKFNPAKYNGAMFFLDALIALFSAVGAGLMLLRGPQWSTFTIPMVGVAAGLILTRLGLFYSKFEDDLLRLICLVTITFFASYQFTIAKRSAENILTLTSYKKIVFIQTNNTKLDSMAINNPVLGSTSNFIFVLTPDKKVMTLNNSIVRAMTTADAFMADTLQKGK